MATKFAAATTRRSTFAPVTAFTAATSRPTYTGADAATRWVLPSSSSHAAAAFALSACARRPSRQNKLPIVRASWGADVAFAPARILETSKVADNLHRLIVDIGSEAAVGYKTPGQFLQAKIGDDCKPGFFAIASPPNDTNNAGVVELLIKDTPGGAAELLCRANAGDEVLCSAPMGKGFRLDSIPASSHSKVYLFATGSGISPIKAVIESGALNAAQREACVLYFGVRNAAAMPYADLVDTWQKEHGIKVVTVFSEDGSGYIQDVFVKDGGVSAGDGGNVAALLCGQKGMAEAVTAALTEGGVPKESILMNF